MPPLQVHHLTKTFGSFKAVNNISFNLEEGEILGMLGPNGAGKTTTLQMLLGVLTPTSGNIYYFGKDLSLHRSEIAKQINFSSTYINLPWILKVKECLEIMARLYDIPNRKQKIEETIKLFELEKLLENTVDSLSAGQTTRLNLAKSFLNDPKIILLDEPTASLDPDVAFYIRDFLKKYRKEHNTSIIITSHNMAEVEELCDRVLFINHGKLVANNTPETLAKTITISHLELLISKGQEKIPKLCQTHNLQFKEENGRTTIDLEEQLIPKFLSELSSSGIHYLEISIQKPTLEDYFLTIVNRNEL